MIDIDGAAARLQATNICNANDKLSIHKTVNFSSSTTVPGNASAETTFNVLKASAATIQQLLNRDVENIHSAVAAFERSDQKIANLIGSVFN